VKFQSGDLKCNNICCLIFVCYKIYVMLFKFILVLGLVGYCFLVTNLFILLCFLAPDYLILPGLREKGPAHCAGLW